MKLNSLMNLEDLLVPNIWIYICTREHRNDDGSSSQSIFIPDGMYGSFNALTYDHAEPHFELCSFDDIKDEKKFQQLYGVKHAILLIAFMKICNGLNFKSVTC